jgi:hypothetical protein
MEQPVEPLSELLVREIFTAFQSCLAKLDTFYKAGFLRQIPANGLLCQRIRVTTSLRRQFRELMLLLRREMYFHTRQSRTTNRTCQRMDFSTLSGAGPLFSQPTRPALQHATHLRPPIALESLTVLAVIGATRRPRRGPTDDQRQVTLFEE